MQNPWSLYSRREALERLHDAYEQAARRELREELNLDNPVLGPCVWVREFTYRFRGRDCRQLERFYLCETPAFEPPPLDRPELVQEEVLECRWWTQEDLRSAGGTTFAPRTLPSLLERLLAEGPPPEPIDTGL
jgi:hypothetical protein